MSQFLKALRRVLINEFIIGIPFSASIYYMMLLRGCDIGGELPTFTWVALEIIVHTLVEEVGFYYSHRYTDILATSWQNLFMPYANNKDAVKPERLHSLFTSYYSLSE